MLDKAPGWVDPIMRAGYAARGIVYGIVGGLACNAAFDDDDAEGTTSALANLLSEPWGAPLLVAIAIGLWAYTLWRVVAAVFDLESYGGGLKGIVARFGQAVTGLAHAALGYSIGRLAFGYYGSGDGSGDGAEDWTARVLALPQGVWIVAAAGAAILGAGAYYAKKGALEEYKDHLRRTWLAERLNVAVKIGYLAQGVALAIVGGFVILAAFNSDPSQAGGLGQAFEVVRRMIFGRILLAALALGLVAFGIANLVEAACRYVPRLAGRDVPTLASRAKARVSRAV